MFFLALAVIIGLYVAWSIGANDSANSMGTAVGSKALSPRQGILLGAVFGFIGAAFLGENVIRTIGSGIIPAESFSLLGQAFFGSLLILLAAALFITGASLKALPVSTTQAVVGAVVGFGLARAVSVSWTTVSAIALSWITAPLFGLAGGFAVYAAAQRIIMAKTRNLLQREKIEQLFVRLQIVSAALLALSFGANDIANVVGVFFAGGAGTGGSEIFLGNMFWLKVLGAAGFSVGILTLGPKVIETMARGVLAFRMTPVRGFIAQFTAALIVLAFTQAGMPVSTTHVAVGALMGAGMVGGANRLNWPIIGEILSSWILALPAAAGLAFAIAVFF